jgi:hypothetical protein
MLVGADGIGWENQGISCVSLNQPKMKNRLLAGMHPYLPWFGETIFPMKAT